MNRIKELKEVNWRELKPLQPDNAKIVFNYQAIENSLKKYGFAQPFFGWEYEGAVYTIDGHTRKEVLSNMENVPETLPCVLVDAKDRKEAIEMLIEVYNQKHNPFDIEVLEEMIEIDQLDVDIDTINVKIETEEIEGVEHLEAEEDDFDAEPPAEPITVLGDLYEIGEHRLLCGDSTDSDQVAKLMNGQKADMVFTDPPYGMKLDADYSGMKSETFQGGFAGKKHINIKGDHEDFTEELINTIFACFNDCKEIFIWGADYFAELLPNKNDGSWIVWDKRASGNDDIYEDKIYDKMYGSTFELCWSKNKHKREIARIKWAGVFGMPTQDTKGRVHPTQKPIELANWFFNKWGKDNDLIADLYLGGGTTMVAAHQLKRKCYGMELDQKYCDVIVKRMLKLDDKLTVKRNGIDCTKEFKD